MLLARQVLRDAFSQRVRTLLTALGIAWGTCAICLLLALGLSLREELSSTMRGLGEGMVIAWPGETTAPWQGLPKGRQIRLDEPDIAFLRDEVPDIVRISSEYRRALRITNGPATALPSTTGVHPDYASMRGITVLPGGRFVNETDIASRRRVAVLGDKLARELFGRELPVGRNVMLGGTRFLVIGVMAPRKQDTAYSGRSDDESVYIPATSFRILATTREMNSFTFQSRDTADTEAAKAGVLAALARRHRFDPRDIDALRMWDTNEHLKFNKTFTAALLAFLGLMGLLILTVSAIGLANVMNVAVEERRREIGIKMALGARPRLIGAQFLGEALLIALLGGGAGFATARGLCAVLRDTAGSIKHIGSPEVSTEVALAAAAALGIAGFLAGWFPARAAARLDPVVAMKSVS